jgi:hypothetical protein
MKARNRFFCIIILACLLVSACAPALTPTPSVMMVSIADLLANYSAYAGQLLNVTGYGVVMQTAPLCPGYTGMDTRLRFIGEADSSIPAVLSPSALGMDRGESLRQFQVYVRIFSGDLGCPGSLQSATFPYLEILGVAE